MKLLLTGYDGFVGLHMQNMIQCEPLADDAWIPLDDVQRLKACVARVKPDAIIHLAAQSNVPNSIQDPISTYEVNFFGTFNLLNALKQQGFSGRFLYIGSGDVYGKVAKLPVTENTILKPRNPYAVSKVAAEALCYQWSQTSTMQIVMTRSFNHVGPGQVEDFVIASLAKQVIEIKHGKRKPQIYVGDIDVTRDFTDVRDVIRAYLLLLEKGDDGAIYNVCSGHERSIRSILTKLIALSGVEVEIIKDEKRLRKSEQRKMVGDNTKLIKATSWQPNISWEQTLVDILNYYEEQV